MYLKQKGEMPVHTYKAGSASASSRSHRLRAATVKTSVAGQLWGLDQVTFRYIVMAANMHVLDDQASFLKWSILSLLTDEQRADLAGVLIEEMFEDGEYIVKGEAADSLYFIKREVVAHEGGRQGRHREGHHANAHRCAARPPARPPARPRRPPAPAPPAPHPRPLLGGRRLRRARSRR